MLLVARRLVACRRRGEPIGSADSRRSPRENLLLKASQRLPLLVTKAAREAARWTLAAIMATITAKRITDGFTSVIGINAPAADLEQIFWLVS